MGEYYELLKAKKMGAGGGSTEEYNAGKTVPQGSTVIIDGVTYTVGSGAEIFNNYGDNKAVGDYSHAEGSNTIASGNWSHAEGSYTTASGTYSHAEGVSTTASAFFSHAEGYNTTASENFSHAEGGSTTASGTYSHAEGSNTTASGRGSHAECTDTTASGHYSHAEGLNCVSSATCSHAEGDLTKASSPDQHVEGRCNVEDSQGKFAHIIGNGTADNARSNAFAVDWDGKIYVNNSATGVDVSVLDDTISELNTTITNVDYNNLIEYDLEGYTKKVNTEGTWEDNRYTIDGVTFVFNADGTVNTFGVSTSSTIEVIYGRLTLTRKAKYLSLTGCPAPSSITHAIRYRNYYDRGDGCVCTPGDINNNYLCDISIYLRQEGTDFNGLCFKPMILAVPSATISKAEYIPYAPTNHELMIRSNAIMKGQPAYTTYLYPRSLLVSGVTRVIMGVVDHVIDNTYDVTDNGLIYYNATAIPTHELTLENVALYDDIKRSPATTDKGYVANMKDNGYGVTIRGFVTVSKNGTDTTYYADPMYAKYEEESENRSKEEDKHLKINSNRRV